MNRKPKSGGALSWGLKILRLLVAVWLLFAVGIWMFQDALVFHPPVDPDVWPRIAPSAGANATRVEIERDGGDHLRGWFVRGSGEGARPTIVYFGGNSENVARRVGRHDDLVRRGWSLIFIAYRGYGPSSGDPDVGALSSDAIATARWARAHPDVDKERIVLWGSSLGTGAAVSAAGALGDAVCGVVLFAPWPSLAAIGQDRFPLLPVSWLLRADVKAAESAPSVTAPVLVVHGTADRTIPYRFGRELADALPGEVTFVTLDGVGHSFTLGNRQVGEAFDAFLAARMR